VINFLKKKINQNHHLKKIYIIFKYYFFIKRKISQQLFDKNIKFETLKNKKIIFTLVETSHPTNFFLMLLAKILQIRGYQVSILVCDSFLKGCEIKSIRSINDKNVCFSCKFNQNKVYPFFKLPIMKLSKFYNKKINLKVNNAFKRYKNNSYNFQSEDEFFYLNSAIKDSVERYFYGNVKEKKITGQLYKVIKSHLSTAILIHEISKDIDNKYNPIAVVSAMSVYSSWYPFFYYFKNNGNRFKQLSLTQYNLKSLVFNEFELFPALNRFKKFLNSRKNKNLTRFENITTLKFIKDRFKGYSEIFKIDSYYEKKNVEEIKNLLKIDKNKKNIFLFTNVFWDVGLTQRGLIFNSIKKWVFYTIDLLKNNSNYHIYIKPHPAEFKSAESAIGFEEIIKNKYKDSISNITFIKADYKIKPYDLKPFIDLALVFNGTLNIEFMIQKVPVISCGLSPTLGMGLNKEIRNITEYKKVLMNNDYNFSNFIVKNYKKLIIFVYFYFIKNSIPWNYTQYVYGENFKGFNFKSLDILNKSDPMINHWIKCITKGDKFVPENW
jgi:hypothetical protein